jgi:hypothetical protein
MTMAQFKRVIEQCKQQVAQKQKHTFSADPTQFCRETLGFNPTAYQIELILQFQNSQFIAARWARQTGKSHTISALLLHYALTNPNSNIGIVGPSWRQTKLIIKHINNLLQKRPKSEYHKPQKTTVALTNGSTIEAYPNNPETIRGPTLHIVYADEFNFIPNDEEPNTASLNALSKLEQIGFDAALLSSETYSQKSISQIGKEPILNVLEELSKKDAAVRKRLANLQNVYPRHEEFTQKINTLDAVGLAKILKRLSFTAQTKIYLFWK